MKVCFVRCLKSYVSLCGGNLQHIFFGFFLILNSSKRLRKEPECGLFPFGLALGYPISRSRVMNLNRFERYPLTFGPSPITPLKRLSQHLGARSSCMPNVKTATVAWPLVGTRRASSNTSFPKRSSKAAIRWSPSAASSRTRPARSLPSLPTWA